MKGPLQLVLDFFTGADPAPPPSPPSRSAAGSAPEAPSAQAGFIHPAANRHAQLHGMTVSYRFERSRRRSIGFVVGPEGLSVRAPGWVPLREVDAAVQEKGAWILAKLQQFQQRRSEALHKRIDWSHGASVPYLGRSVRLCVHAQEVPHPASATAADDQMVLSLPPQASSTQVREAAQAWLKARARALFESRLQHFAPQVGVQWTRLSLSSAATRWGSAGSDGHIRLNWRLIHLPLAQIDYVVVHELAHLRVMDHSPRFWATVGQVMPDYAQRRQQLRQSAADTGL
jgi:predicted metal-dependent hydrolase